MGLYLVMELLEGETLRERISRSPTPARVAFDVMDQVTGAVRYIHGRGIVHCDLKPENIFLSQVPGEPRRTNQVKLLDFGLSWRAESLPDTTLGGTPPYLAPERLRGDPPAPPCDVYSLGVLLYELLTGRWPYSGTQMEIIDQQLAGAKPPLPSQLSSEPLGERVDALVMHALQREPEERHASIEAFHFELRALMRMAGMKVRRRMLMSESAMPSLGGADAIAQAVAASPVPLAIFEPSGSVRFANRAFVDLIEGAEAERLPRFDELRVVERDPGLRTALSQAVTSMKPVRRMILAGAAPNERMYVLVLAPAPAADGEDEAHLDSVHATLIDTRLE
jgi:PAS domain-containing protein